MTRKAALIAVLVAAAGLISMVVLSSGSLFGLNGKGENQFAQCGAGAVAGDLGGPFTLINGAGETVTNEDVITEPSLIYFGYTSCPDICPMDVDRNARAVEILEERGQSVTPVFITIDPARDTVDIVREYAANMHPRMIGLTGSDEQIAVASKAYRTYYKTNPPVDGEYLVDHSTFSYLVTPENGFVEFFRREVSAEDMADKIGCFVDQI